MELETTLRVGSKTAVADLASAVAHGVYDGKLVLLRAIGAGAVSQAIKAVAVARGLVAPRGIDLALVPGFVSITMDDGVVTGILLKVVVL